MHEFVWADDEAGVSLRVSARGVTASLGNAFQCHESIILSAHASSTIGVIYEFDIFESLGVVVCNG